jgi:hypothetical protein
MPRVVHAEIA